MTTLTQIGITKQLERLKSSLTHVTYLLDGQQQQADISRIDVAGDSIKIFVILDDSISGTVSNISLIDNEGDTIAFSSREFLKPAEKGLYSVFSYKFVEVDN